MKITIEIEIYCPKCGSPDMVCNGKKEPDKSGHCKQTYLCKDCGHQPIADHERTYRGGLSYMDEKIEWMAVHRCGAKDTAEIEGVSKGKVLSVLSRDREMLPPTKSHYEELQVDEFYSFVGSKENKTWGLYAYDPAGEIVTFVFGDRSAETAERLRDKLVELGVTWDRIASDDWRAFKKVFQDDNHVIGKEYTRHIEGNNCRLRHTISRLIRRACNFSKKFKNHVAVFTLAVNHINKSLNPLSYI